jgi:pimeloyl-ACP methyl ester carboxylesterase
MPVVDGLNLRIEGDGEPALVFVHGFGCALEDWDAQFAALAGSRRCLALDLPGHGASAQPRTPTMDAFAAAVSAAMDAAGIGRAILVGHSLGSKVVRACFGREPGRVSGLVFVDGSVYEGDHATVAERTRRRIAEAGYAAFARALFSDMFVAGSDDRLRERLIARACRLDPAFAEAVLMESIRWDSEQGKASLAVIDVPVLVVQSTAIDATMRRVSLRPGMETPFMRLVAGSVAGSRAHVVENTEHFPMIDAPDAFNVLLRGFLAEA